MKYITLLSVGYYLLPCLNTITCRSNSSQTVLLQFQARRSNNDNYNEDCYLEKSVLLSFKQRTVVVETTPFG